MPRVASDRDEIVRTTVRIPRHIVEDAKACARTVNMSLNAWVCTAVAQRNRKWRHPSTGERLTDQMSEQRAESKWDGWVCTHGSHAVMPAAECPARDKQVHRQEMVHEATGQVGWSPPEEG